MASEKINFVTLAIFSLLGAMLFVELTVIWENPPAYTLQKLEEYKRQQAVPLLDRSVSSGSQFPLVLLYRARYPEGESWDTAYWPGWGSKEGNMQNRIIEQDLVWAAEGVHLTKSCNVPCYITRDQSRLTEADVVVMEAVGHTRELSEKYSVKEFFPPKYKGQKWAMFHYEPIGYHREIIEDEFLRDQFEILISPKQYSTIPITLICDWGRSRTDYLLPPPPKIAKPNFICDFSLTVEGNVEQDVVALKKLIGVDSYYGKMKNKEPEEPFSIPSRLREISKYKFAIISEGVLETDWVSPEWSQAFLAGTVPIYVGAQNIKEFAPGPNSFIDLLHFGPVEELVEHLNFVNENDDEYMKYFDWKENGLSDSFKRHLDNCAHLAECRLCKHIINDRNNNSQ